MNNNKNKILTDLLHQEHLLIRMWFHQLYHLNHLKEDVEVIEVIINNLVIQENHKKCLVKFYNNLLNLSKQKFKSYKTPL